MFNENNLEPKKNPVIMNRYNNKYGYHTPEMTEGFYMVINKEIKDGIELIDSSWHNDMVDSFEWHIIDGVKYFSIMLPNSSEEDIDEELWNTFVITDENQDTLLCTTDINDVIAFLNGKYEDMLHSDADKPLCEQAEDVSNKMHFLFGSDAVEVYESEGIDVLIQEYEDNNLGYELYEWIDGESNPADLLYCFNGLGDYIVISEEDYKKLS